MTRASDRPEAPAPTEAFVRRATPDDAAVIAANNIAMARETEDKELDTDRIRRGVEAALTQRELAADYWVVERDGCVVAQTMITREWSDWRNGWFWWIQSVYVAPEARRTGLFRKIYDTVVTAAHDQGDVIGIRLYVERDNAGARKVYETLGMHCTAYDLYEVDWSD